MSNGYLIDTNVISELCKRHDRINPGVRRWLDATPGDRLFTSPLVVGELRQGVLRLQRRDPVQAAIIQARLDQLTLYTRSTLAVDLAVAQRWARLYAGNPLPVVDSLLAATALVHDLVVVTRNVGDFAATGASCLNPFDAPPTFSN